MNTRGQRSLRAIFESWLPQWGKSEHEGLLFLILFYSTTGVPDVGVEELPLWCIYITEFSHPLTLLCPGALALGHADRACCSSTETDGLTVSEDTEMQHEKGEVVCSYEPWRMWGRLGRLERGEQQVPPWGARRRTIQRTTKKGIGMPPKVFEQGGCAIKIYSSRINLALACEWFEGGGTKEGESSWVTLVLGGS